MHVRARFDAVHVKTLARSGPFRRQLGAVKLVALGQGLFALVEVGGPHAMLKQHGMRVGLDAVSLLRHLGRYARLVTSEDEEKGVRGKECKGKGCGGKGCGGISS